MSSVPSYTVSSRRDSQRVALIPIRDINPRVRVPVVNYALLVLCAGAFIFQLSLGDGIDPFFEQYGFVPNQLDEALASLKPAALLTSFQAVVISMFLHGGWFHIIGNLLYLRVFGDNIEDRFGHVLFLAFYLASGLAGAAAQYLYDPNSYTPVVGASGAIAGILGVYVVLYPRAKVVTLFPIFIFLTFIEVPAVVFLGIWALQQLLNGYLSLGTTLQGGIAWFAHIGGFSLGALVGVVVRLAFKKKTSRRQSSVARESERP